MNITTTDLLTFANGVNASRTLQRLTAKESFVKRLNSLISRAPIIRYPYGTDAVEMAAYARRRG